MIIESVRTIARNRRTKSLRILGIFSSLSSMLLNIELVEHRVLP